jgi:hypothetical protein
MRSSNQGAHALLYLQRQCKILDDALSRIGEIAIEPGGNYQEALAYAQEIAEEARREAGMLPQ